MWPETIEAVATAIKGRLDPVGTADDRLAFLTARGLPWVRMTAKPDAEPGQPAWTGVDAAGQMFGDLLASLGLNRKGLGFYALRHTFETIAGETRDQPAVNAIMGHDPGDMASLYRERIGDDRLRAVVVHVRGWLLNGEEVQHGR